jgi:peptide chain release factor 2
LPAKEKRLAELEEQAAAPGFWNNQEAAQQAMREVGKLRAVAGPWRDLSAEIGETLELLELVRADDPAGETQDAQNLATSADDLRRKLSDLELRMMLSGPMDANNAFVELHPGQGGTESCDWAHVLMRMYMRWAERRGFEVEEVDFQEGEEAGIKAATLLIKGENAYGYLRSETGVHRLVRISPFDSQSRRQTSFASAQVTPEVDDSIEIDIDEKDLRVDTYRASGAGGQHVNKTSSAVRITHIPTNTVVQCQNERSQHKNRALAIKMLRARLYQREQEARQKERDAAEAAKTDIGFGHQIRNYVLHPYNLVKDTRTEEQTSNTSAVLDGDIDRFIEAYLRQSMGATIAAAQNGAPKK